MASVDAGAVGAPVGAAAVEARVDVEVVWSPAARETLVARLSLPRGASLGEALAATGWASLEMAARGDAAFAAAGLSAAIWSKPCPLGQVVGDGDRVEVLRALAVTPMEARRARYEAAGGAKALRRRRLAAQQQKR